MFDFLKQLAQSLDMEPFSQRPALNQPIVFFVPLRDGNIKSMFELTFVYGIYTYWYRVRNETDHIRGSAAPMQLLPAALRQKLLTFPHAEVVLINPKLTYLCDERWPGVVACENLDAGYWTPADRILASGKTAADELGLNRPKVNSALTWNGNSFNH